MRDLNAKVVGAKNFRYGELIRSEEAIRRGISNVPNSETIWHNLEVAASHVLQPLRNNFGPIRVNSGYRSAELCVAIGSTPASNHTLGCAFDLEPIDTRIKLIDIMDWIVHNLAYRELIAEYFPEGWVHCAYLEGGNKRDLKLKDKNHNYAKVDFDYIKGIYG